MTRISSPWRMPLASWVRRTLDQMRPQPGPGFVRAYAAHLANRVPLLYAIVFTNNLVLSVRFYGSAPDILTVWVPLACVVPLALRAVYWMPSRIARRSTDRLRRDLESLAIVGPIVAFLCTAWALSLYSFGDTPQRSIVHYIVGVTCFASILGLGQSPVAAARMAVVSLLPATAWFLLHDHPNSVAVSAVQLTVGTLLLFVTFGYHRDFVELERARQITARREREANDMASLLQTLATHDPLTGTQNRRALLDRFEECLADPSEPAPWLALVDLDGFKQVNDTYGHAAGDAVLKVVCDRIKDLPDVISFGRLGGDEFAILLPASLSPAEARLRLTDLIGSISQPVLFERYQLMVTASIGLHLGEGRSVTECLERADAALYEAKQKPGRVIEFSERAEVALEERQEMTRAFSAANLESQISLVYQQIIDFDQGAIESFEVFSRWSPEGRETSSPGVFVGLAESTGRSRELTAVVLKRALTECPVWKVGGSLSINLSAHDLVGEDAAGRIHSTVVAAGAPATSIILEVTETALMADTRRSAQTLANLRNLGFRIALDDFGTGQSSLARVHQLPLDQLKIDRSFAQNIDSDVARQAIASTILALARQLGLGCTIEGIETAEQAATARTLGIRSMQGFFFGRPVPYSQALAAARAA